MGEYMKTEENILSIIVASCDRYSDLWRPFSLLFKKYWSDCPFEISLVTENDVVAKEDTVFDRVIACGRGIGWGDRLVTGLDQIKTPYVLMLCEDYLLCDRVDTDKIKHLLCLAKKYHAGNLRMIQNPKHSRIFSEIDDLGEYEKGTAYCVATQAGLWDVSFLKRLAKGYNSIWEFERLGSFRCMELDQPVLGTRKMTFPFEDAVHKGRWEESSIRLCDRNGIEIDFSRREKMTDIMMVKEHLKGAILNLNPNLIVRLQNLLRLGKK